MIRQLVRAQAASSSGVSQSLASADSAASVGTASSACACPGHVQAAVPTHAGEPICQQGNVSLWNQSGAPDCLEFSRGHVQAKPPPHHAWTFLRHDRVEKRIGPGESGVQPLQFRLGRETVEFEQVSKSSNDRSHPQAERVLDSGARFQILASHPQALGNFRDAAAVLWLAQAVDQRSLKVADPNRILLGNPVRAQTEKVLCLHEHKPELRVVDGPGSEPLVHCQARKRS